MFRDHRRVAAESVEFVSHRLGTSLLVWLLIGISLALPAGLYLLERNLAMVSDQWEGRAGFSVYFRPGIASDEVDSLAEELKSRAEVQSASVVSPDAALEEFRSYAEIADALELLESNPLPASIRATLRGGVTPAQFLAVERWLERIDGVEEVAIETTWMERLQALTDFVSRLGWVLTVTFGLGAVLVTSASVRLAIEARLEEIRVLKLVGSTQGFLRRPFLYFGAVYGFGGGVVGAMIIAAVLILLEAPLGAMFASYGQDLEFVGFDPIFLGTLLAIGAVLGVGGAIVASNQRLRELDVL